MHSEKTLPKPADLSPKPKKPRLLRRLVRGLEHLLAALGLLMLLLWTTPIIDYAYPRLDRLGPLAPAQYIICLGGDPYRILESVQLLKEGYAPKLIVSNIAGAATMMRNQAIAWGAPPDQVLVDDLSSTTAAHPMGIVHSIGLDPANDRCIIVTSYLHMARSQACFEKAGYRQIIMRDPRWEHGYRVPLSIKSRMRLLPGMIYEAAAWVEYKFRGYL